MNAILKILLLFTATRSALALCTANCDDSLPCSEVYSCLISKCNHITEKDLPDKCKCYVKCRDKFDSVLIRKDNCILLQNLKTCFVDGGCDTSNVPEVQKFDKECNNCEPKQCNDGSCLQRLDCMTNSTRGGCASSGAVQTVMNTTSETMHNAWFLPENCSCFAKCPATALRFVPSCVGYETIMQCEFKHSCKLLKKEENIGYCECEYGCNKEINEAMEATVQEKKCMAKKAYQVCAAKFGCNRMPIKLQNIKCESPPENGSSFFGSEILLTILIVFTILFTFTTTNVIMT